MADIPVLNQGKENFALLHADNNTETHSLLSREAYLIGGGIKDGFVDRLQQAKENLGLTALEFAGAAAVGAGLTAMSMAGGRWSAAAKIGTAALQVLAIGDGIRRLAPTAYAVGDTMVNADHYLENRATVARYLGSACFDYPLMAAGGLLGSTSAGYAPKLVSSIGERFNLKSSPAGAIASENPFYNKNLLDPSKPFSAQPGADLNPIKDTHPSPGHDNLIDPAKTELPAGGVKAHENPPGAWQKNVPEGSNVNWLNNGGPLETVSNQPVNLARFEPVEGVGNQSAGAGGVKAHENPPGAWQQKMPEGSAVNWLNAGQEKTAAPEVMSPIKLSDSSADAAWADFQQHLNRAKPQGGHSIASDVWWKGDSGLKQPQFRFDLTDKIASQITGKSILIETKLTPVYPAVFTSWSDNRKELHEKK